MKRIKNKYIAEFDVWVTDSNNVFELLEEPVRVKLPSISNDYIGVAVHKILCEKLNKTVGNFELVSYKKIK